MIRGIRTKYKRHKDDIIMNRFLCFILGVTVLAATSSSAQESNVQTVEPVDHGRALVNPQMGWQRTFIRIS